MTSADDRHACAVMEQIIAESQRTDEWYESFDDFAALLDHPKSLVRNRALRLLAANARWDRENRFDAILPVYLAHVTDEKPITARQCIQALAQVGLAKPQLIPRILSCFQKADLSKYRDSMRPLIEKDLAQTSRALQGVISYPEALRIAAEFAEEINHTFPGCIRAVYAIGSLGSDYYRPGQSDIDTAVITTLPRAEAARLIEPIEAIASRYQAKYQVPKGVGAIVFAGEQLYPPYVREEELVQEILRLKTQARRIWGEDALAQVPMPDWQAIREDIRHFQEWCDSQPPMKHSATSFVNSTLIALKRYLLLGHHIIEFNKFEVVDLYLQNDPIWVNEEIFGFVQDYLHDRPYTWNDEIRGRYGKLHDELYRVINRAVL